MQKRLLFKGSDVTYSQLRSMLRDRESLIVTLAVPIGSERRGGEIQHQVGIIKDLAAFDRAMNSAKLCLDDDRELGPDDDHTELRFYAAIDPSSNYNDYVS